MAPEADPQHSPPTTAAIARAANLQRTAAESQVTLTKAIEHAVCDDRDHLELGYLLEWMDAASCLSAEKHCGRYAVTLVMDDLDFAEAAEHVPQRGQICILEGKVTRAFGSSMEVSVHVWLEDLASASVLPVCHAYFMYVVLKTEEEKASKAKIDVPGLLPQTVEERLEFDLAATRRSFRIQREKRVQEFFDSTPKPGPNELGPDTVHSDSVSFTELVLPTHANHMGNTFGGQIMSWMAKAASVAVWLHLRGSCKTSVGKSLKMSGLKHLCVRAVAVDQVHFKSPSHVGDRVQVTAQVTRVLEGTLEVLVRVTSAAVSSQDHPEEVNEGNLTFRVCGKDGAPLTAIPDVAPRTQEQINQHHLASARQRFRELRRTSAPRPHAATSSSSLSVDFNAGAQEASELAVHCLSAVLRVAETPDIRWEAMPSVADGIQVFVEGLNSKSQMVRLKISATAKCMPRVCFDLLRDASRRRDWDITCLDSSAVGQVGGNAELVRLILAPPSSRVLPRESLLLRAWCEDEVSGSYVIASRSVRCDSTPPRPGTQRGELLPSGYVISSAPGSSGTNTSLTFLGQLHGALFELEWPHVMRIMQSFLHLVETGAVITRSDTRAMERQGTMLGRAETIAVSAKHALLGCFCC